MADISTELYSILNDVGGEEVRDSIIDALRKINAEGLPVVTEADNGKILIVSSDGEWFTSKLLQSIAITTMPTKTSYEFYERLDYSGLVVTATYLNGSTENVTSMCVFDPAEGTEVSLLQSNTITVSYTLDNVVKTATLSITIGSSYDVSYLVITRYPDKMIYDFEEPFDVTGLEVTAVFSDGHSLDITDQYELDQNYLTDGDPVIPDQSNGDARVRILYYFPSKEQYSNIMVLDFYAHTHGLTGITVDSYPTKKSYLAEITPMDWTGLQVTANYADGTTKDVTDDCRKRPAQGAVCPSNGPYDIYYWEGSVNGHHNMRINYPNEPTLVIWDEKLKMIGAPKTMYDLTGGYNFLWANDSSVAVKFMADDGVITDVKSQCVLNYTNGSSTGSITDGFDTSTFLPSGASSSISVKIDIFYEHQGVTYSTYYYITVDPN